VGGLTPARRLIAVFAAAISLSGLLHGFSGSRRWAKYEREMQSPSDDPPDAMEETEFAFARLRYSGNRDRPRYRSWGIDSNTSERHFITGLRRLTRIYGRSVEQIVDIDSDELFDWPWIYVVSGGDWVLTDEEGARLRKYFDRGGFMVVDDFHGPGQWEQFIDGIRLAFPDAEGIDLDSSHPIFHTVYDLTDRLQVPGYQIVERGLMYERSDGVEPYWRVVQDEKGRIRIATFLNQDLGDAWEFSNDPAYPEHFASMAYRMGINYVVYSMTH
jgi:hypothetical protein